MKQAILLLSNKKDFVVRKLYDLLQKDYGEKSDVFLLFDTTNSMDIEHLKSYNHVYSFCVEDLLAEGYSALESGFLGNCHYPLLKFHKDYPEYDFIWLVEDDVMFNGNWSTLFNSFLDNPSDIVSSKVRNYKEDKYWYWWDSVKAPKDVKLNNDDLYASFNPVYRLSAKILECLEIEMHKGWRGHFEALIPTIAVRCGLTMCDINDNNKSLCFYTENTHNWLPLNVIPYSNNMIYHPIKEKIKNNIYRKNAIISIVGKNSRHRNWNIEKSFDYHIIVKDNVFNNYYDEADFAYYKNGKMHDLVCDYFFTHPSLMQNIKFVLILNNELDINTESVELIFKQMGELGCDFMNIGFSSCCYSIEAIKSIFDGYSPSCSSTKCNCIGSVL